MTDAQDTSLAVLDEHDAAPAGPVVLLVDDQTMIAEALKEMLSDQQDISFHYCQDPARAIPMAMEVKATCILQDLVMPQVDGITLVRFFRHNPATSDVPIIVLSSKEDSIIKRDAFEQGANDYLVKPPDKIELVARVRAHTKSYTAQKERDEAFSRLREMQERLEKTNAELEKSNDILQKLSSLDGLTGVANRRSFEQSLEREWRRAKRELAPLSLIIMDIDFFKLYNDHYGHLGGDECLISVAKSLAESVQRPGDTVCRYGGEEFAAILPDTDMKGAEKLAERFRSRVVAMRIQHDRSTVSEYVSISIGTVTMLPQQPVDIPELIQLADQALYKAKRNGRNCFEQSDSLATISIA